jgi:hypothetical protein
VYRVETIAKRFYHASNHHLVENHPTHYHWLHTEAADSQSHFSYPSSSGSWFSKTEQIGAGSFDLLEGLDQHRGRGRI